MIEISKANPSIFIPIKRSFEDALNKIPNGQLFSKKDIYDAFGLDTHRITDYIENADAYRVKVGAKWHYGNKKTISILKEKHGL